MASGVHVHVQRHSFMALDAGSAVQYDYGSLISMGFRFYDAQRIGALPANYTIPWRSSALLQVCL